jgi:hypothetical protein
MNDTPKPVLLDDRSMGARVIAPKKSWQDEARARIDAEAIIDKFQAFFHGTLVEGEKIALDSAQIKVGETLLKKKLPDLQSVQLSGDADGGPIKVTRVEIVAAGMNDDGAN